MTPTPTVTAGSVAGSSGSGGLRAIWLRLAIFAAIPALLVGLPIYLIDPFGLFYKASVLPQKYCLFEAQAMNDMLVKVPRFARAPQPNWVLGDSEMEHLAPPEQEQKLIGRRFSNLAYRGGTIREETATFWYAVERYPQVQHVYLGLTFINFDDRGGNRFPHVRGIVQNPLLYFVDLDAAMGSFSALQDTLTSMPIPEHYVGPPAQWEHAYYYITTRAKDDPRAAAPMEAEIQKIVDYGHDHHIEISFVIPPEYEEVGRRIEQSGLTQRYADFKRMLASWGTTYDCDVPSVITTDVRNFSDPLHLTDEEGHVFAHDLWSGHPNWCRVLGGGRDERTVVRPPS